MAIHRLCAAEKKWRDAIDPPSDGEMLIEMDGEWIVSVSD